MRKKAIFSIFVYIFIHLFILTVRANFLLLAVMLTLPPFYPQSIKPAIGFFINLSQWAMIVCHLQLHSKLIANYDEVAS